MERGQDDTPARRTDDAPSAPAQRRAARAGGPQRPLGVLVIADAVAEPVGVGGFAVGGRVVVGPAVVGEQLHVPQLSVELAGAELVERVGAGDRRERLAQGAVQR
jgi:hypothetical protein